MSALLTLEGVHKHYPVSAGGILTRKTQMLRAVDGVDLVLRQGESFGLAGESGSGKSTIGKMILRLEAPTGGRMVFEGRDFAHFDGLFVKRYRTQVQAVFQDASGSLNPRMRIGEVVAEPLEIHRSSGDNALARAEIRERAADMLGRVGLSARMLDNYPHELSGGQKQRVAIARAMVLEPSLVMLDEPVSALDVSIRAQILNLLADLQDQFGLTYFMISHDLATLGHFSSSIAVMYLGRIIEVGPTAVIYGRPQHPYTRALFQSMPVATPGRLKSEASIRGEIGSALDLPRGCRFCPRCELAEPVCREVDPQMVRIDGNHSVACHVVARSFGKTVALPTVVQHA
jgi:oligopeptide/dipeptide ABC transporter ATP-binding protein